MAGTTTTLFLRSMPVDIVRAAKAAAARRGSTLGPYVAEALESAARIPDREAESAGELSAEMAWFDRNEDRLRKRFPNEFVAVVGTRVVDHDRDFDALARRVFAKFGNAPVLMPRLAVRTEPLRLRSPRVSKR